MERTKYKIKNGDSPSIEIVSPKFQIHKFDDQEDDDELFMEREITKGMIVDDLYCQWVVANFPLHYLCKSAQQIVIEIVEYYKTQNHAPRQDMESIFFNMAKNKKYDKDTLEDIEQILTSLNQEYENEGGKDFEYLKRKTYDYLLLREIETKNEQAKLYLDKGDLKKALELIPSDFSPMDSITKHIRTIEEMKAMGVKRPKLLMKPWLREGETTILYSEAGVGKSLLAILVAYLLGLKKYSDDGSEIGEWQVKHPTGTLYIDGELGQHEMLDRIDKFSWIGEQKFPMRVFSIPDYQISSSKDYDLSKREAQNEIIDWLKKNPDYKFLIIDSVSTVFGLKEENSNSEWSNKINPFLKNLRALGVAHIIQHHSGKDAKKGLRGASSMSAMAHNIIRLSNHPDKETGFAWFKVENKEKQRAAGKAFTPFYIKFTPNDQTTEWNVTDRQEGIGGNKAIRIYQALINGLGENKTKSSIAKELGLNSDSAIYPWIVKAIKLGYLDHKTKKPTTKGFKLAQDNDGLGDD